MKKLTAISATAILAAFFALTGCNTPGGGSYPWPQLLSTEERTGSKVTLTQYEYDEQTLATSGEVRKVDGRVVYEVDDYEYKTGSTIRYRTTYNEDGTTTRHKLVSHIGNYGGVQQESKYEVFLVGEDGDETTPVEVYETFFNENGYAREIKHTVNGELILHRNNYYYDNLNGTYYTYKESKNGGAAVNMHYRVKEVRSDRTAVGWEIRANWDGETGILVEKQEDYSETSTTSTYKVTRYDDEGRNGVTTHITNTFKILTIEF